MVEAVAFVRGRVSRDRLWGVGYGGSPLSYVPAFIAVATDDEDVFLFQRCGIRVGGWGVDELGEGRVALHEHACVERHVEEAAELVHALGFVFAAAIGEEDEGDVVGLEVGEGGVGAREGGGGAEEDAVDAGGGLVK